MQSASPHTPLTVFTFLGRTAMTPCTLVQRIMKGGTLLKLQLKPGGPIDFIYLYRNGTNPTTGLVDLPSKNAIANVTDDFWNHIASPHSSLKMCVEYDPATFAIIEVYEC